MSPFLLDRFWYYVFLELKLQGIGHMKQHILIIGKEGGLLREIKRSLQDVHIVVSYTDSYRVALDHISRFHYSLIIVDYAFPKMESAELVSKLRSLYAGPILVLSADASEHEEIQALQAGADQYLEIGKHLDVERCVANVRAILRRGAMQNAEKKRFVSVPGYGLKINPYLHRAYICGEDLHLTPTEFTILKCLVAHIGEVVTKEQLYQEVWTGQYDISSDAALKYHIRELRKKLNACGATGLIETAWGIGYLINLDEK